MSAAKNIQLTKCTTPFVAIICLALIFYTCKRDAILINQILSLNDDSKNALQEYINLLKLKEEKNKG